VTAGADRANRIREALLDERPYDRWEDAGSELQALLPPGAVVLTAEELRELEDRTKRAQHAQIGLARDLERKRAKYAALVRAGDVLATRLDETPVPSLFGFEDLDKAKEQQQAVRAWLALAHPDGEGHATEIGERGEVSGATWESATE
jgi:hypothetical protein